MKYITEHAIIYYLIDNNQYNNTFELVSKSFPIIKYKLNNTEIKLEYCVLMEWIKTNDIIVKYDIFDGEWCYEASNPKYPNLNEYADTEFEAYSLILDSIVTTYNITH